MPGVQVAFVHRPHVHHQQGAKGEDGAGSFQFLHGHRPQATARQQDEHQRAQGVGAEEGFPVGGQALPQPVGIVRVGRRREVARQPGYQQEEGAHAARDAQSDFQSFQQLGTGIVALHDSPQGVESQQGDGQLQDDDRPVLDGVGDPIAEDGDIIILQRHDDIVLRIYQTVEDPVPGGKDTGIILPQGCNIFLFLSSPGIFGHRKKSPLRQELLMCLRQPEDFFRMDLISG